MAKIGNKTRKSVAKRFKRTATGKILASHAGKRHLAASKNRKRMRRLGKRKTLGDSDLAKVVSNLPFAG